MRTESVVLKDFKGWNSATVWGSTVADNELVDATNVVITEQNTIVRRRGFSSSSTISTVALGARNMIKYQTPTVDLIIMANSAGTSLVSKTGVLSTNNATLTNTSCVVQFSDLAYIFSPVTNQMATVNSAGTFVTAVANVFATTALVHKRRIFTANNLSSTNVSQIRYSEVFDIGAFTGVTGWPALNTIDVNTGDGDSINSIVELNDSLIIFKTNSTWVLYTDGSPASWSLKRLHSSIGCGFRDSPIVVKGLLYFVSPSAVFRTDGTSFDELSRPIFNVTGSFDASSASLINDGSAAYWNGLYIINPVPTSQVLYVFNTLNETWTRWSTPVAFARFLTYEDDPFYPLISPRYRSSGSGVELWTSTIVGSFTDTSGDFSSSVTFKPMTFDTPNKWKRIISVDVELESQVASTTVEYTAWGEPNDIIKNMVQTISPKVTSSGLHRFPGVGRCRACRVKLESSSPSAVEIMSISYNLLESQSSVGKKH